MNTTVTATHLKAHLLGVLDEVRDSGNPVTVTKHGRPVARLVAIEPASLRGSVEFRVSDDELTEPLGDPWNAVDE